MKYNIKIRKTILTICALAMLTGCSGVGQNYTGSSYKNSNYNSTRCDLDGFGWIVAILANTTVWGAIMFFAAAGGDDDSTGGGNPPPPPSNIGDRIAASNKVVYTIDKFIENPVKSNERINLVDVKNIRTLEDVMHAKQAHQTLQEDGHKAHTLADRTINPTSETKIDSLKTPSVKDGVYHSVYMDADGADKDNNSPLKLFLDKDATFTGMYAHNVDLQLKKTLQCGAFNLDHGKLEIQNDAALKYNSLRVVGSGATIVGGKRLVFSTETPGVASLGTIKTDRVSQYGWASAGGILLEGSIDNLTLTNEVSLDPRSGASVGTLTHNGGTLILSNEHPLTATTYTVSGPSKAQVHWANASNVCLTADNINFNSTVQLKLSELDSGVEIGSTLQLMKAKLEFTGVEASQITKSTEGVGAQYTIAIDQDAQTINLTLSRRTDQTALLSGNVAQTLGKQILNNAHSLSAKRLSVMPLDAANKALSPIGEGAYLSHPTIRTVGLSEWLYNKARGVNSIHSTVEDTQAGLLVPLGGDIRVGCGMNWENQDKKSSVQYSGLMLWGNNFLEAEVNSRANAYKYRAGHIFNNGISLDVQGVSMARSGQMQSDLGMVSVENAQEFKGSLGLGINKGNKISQLQANVRHEVIGYRAKHTLKLNDDMYTIPGQSVSSGWSAQIKSTLLPTQGVVVSAVVGLGHNAHTSLNLNCSLEL